MAFVSHKFFLSLFCHQSVGFKLERDWSRIWKSNCCNTVCDLHATFYCYLFVSWHRTGHTHKKKTEKQRQTWLLAMEKQVNQLFSVGFYTVYTAPIYVYKWYIKPPCVHVFFKTRTTTASLCWLTNSLCSLFCYSMMLCPFSPALSSVPARIHQW